MSGWLQALILGIVQGLTEFLPVSSSGHLVLAEILIVWREGEFIFAKQQLAFNIVLHVGTLLPVLYYYRRDIGRILAALVRNPPLTRPSALPGWVYSDPDRWTAFLVVVGTIPTGLIGIAFKDYFEETFNSVVPVALALLVTGVLLLLTRVLERPDGRVRLALWMALLIGISQGFAITPGISRSGTTIAVALLLGIERDQAARFSFLLSIPAILAAFTLETKNALDAGLTLPPGGYTALAVGFVSSMVVGYLALWMLVGLVRRGGFYLFTIYLWPAAVAAMYFLPWELRVTHEEPEAAVTLSASAPAALAEAVPFVR